jgi:hypothetical protein
MDETPAIEDIADIVPPGDVTNPIIVGAWIVAGLIVAAILITYAAKWIIARSRKAPDPPPIPAPRDWALAELATLRSGEALAPRETALRVSEILREFLARENRVPLATYQTTGEIMKSAPDLADAAEALFERCDELKYAPAVSAPAAAELLIDEVTEKISLGFYQ